MKFQNIHPSSALSFKIRDKVYDVPVDGVVDVPDEYAWVVESRGIKMIPYVEPPPKAAEPEVPKPEKAESKPKSASK